MSFKQFNLAPIIEQTLEKNSFIKPTPIQTKVIPLILQNKDVMAKAQTGSGKSASFILPILHHWLENIPEGKAKIKTLVIAPTRELTLQIADTFKRFSKEFDKKPTVVSIIGGEGIGAQLYDIQQGCDIVVATAGRLLDVISKKQMNLSFLEFFVLDEADKMLDLGFAQELELILKELPSKRCNLLFSATYPPKMLELASLVTKQALEVSIKESSIVQNISQRAIEVNKKNRGPLLRELLKTHNWDLVLVFMATKRATDNIAVKFRNHGIEAESFHGDLEQDERIYTLKDFKDKKIRVLFSTDIAARGLDVEDIACVINFDLPRSPADYVHRIGRTARAGKSGEAISFIDYENKAHFDLIQKRADIKIPLEQIEGFELSGEAPRKKKGKEPIKGKRKSKKDKLREQAKSS